MAADPVKAVMVLKAEIDKAKTEYQKKLVEFEKTMKKLTPKNKQVAASVLDKMSILIEKTRIQILNDRHAISIAETQIMLLREQIIHQYSDLEGLHDAFLKYGNDLGTKTFS